MTVTYSDDIATAKGLTLVKLFLRWKGSVMRLLWKDLLVYLSLFYGIHIIYAYVLNDQFKIHFETIVKYARSFEDLRTLSFVLGFFVSTVFKRWWEQYLAIPRPSTLSVYVSSTLHGYDEVGRAMRRTILRYVNLSLVMIFRVLSPRVKKRFPKMEGLISAGLISESELIILQELEKKYPGHSKNWLPICWAANLACRARADGRIKDDFALKTIIEELNRFRSYCGDLMSYSTICIPLVYTQVVTIAVYAFLFTSVIGKQPIEHSTISGISRDEPNDLYYLEMLPFLPTLQFVFYMGWLKVAETMINPFGEDDDDFDINSMIDRNLILSYLMVDEMHNEHPELLKDQYWNELPQKLPDLGRDEKKSHEKVHMKDIFDVVEHPSSIRHRKGVIVNQELEKEPSKILSAVSKADLKPRSSVIDKSYRRLTGVEYTQSVLEKTLERYRNQMLNDYGSESESEDSKTIIENQKFNE